jgi:hypothetical protein
MDASAAHTLAVLAGLEPLGWLIVLVALYFGGERRQARLSKAGLGQHQSQGSEAPATNYRPLAVLVVLKFLTSLSYPIFQERLFPLGISVAAGHLAYRVVFWGSYCAVTVCVFFVIGSLLKNSLSPLPGLSSAAMIVFRWAAGLAFALAATAHIPVFGIHSWFLWLNEVSVSFALCVCTFEISLLVLMLSRMGKLGMCLRSRPVGLAVGLTLLGFMDLTSALTLNLSTVVVTWVALVAQSVLICVLSVWTYYIVMPEPRRNAHSLAPASKLMRWNEIALKLELTGKQGEQTPFIAGVQLVVDTILDKYNIGKT